MKFTKMHGCGNDYIYVNGFTEKVEQEKKQELVRKWSDRHFGIGGDGVIFINPVTGPGTAHDMGDGGQPADFEMEMYNADGSRAEMCGNGIRCVAKFVYEKGLTDSTSIRVVSCGKVKQLVLSVQDGKVVTVRVNMGAPILRASDIPVISDRKEVIGEEIEVNGEVYQMTCVSMGNPHAVVFLDDVEQLELEAIGPFFEKHPRFPNRVNTEFVEVLDRRTVRMRVWERGTGETLACGTGACAAVAACVLNGLTENEVTVKLLGGELKICWDRDENTVYMTGPAETVFEGEIE